MRNWITIITLISIGAQLSLLAGQPYRLPHILRELETGRNKKIEKAQDQALEILIDNPEIPLQLLNCTLDILLFNAQKNTRFSELHARREYIDDAISLFHTIPNFQPLLVHIIYESCQLLPTTNRWYEIAAALSIEYEQSGETVIAFGKPTDYDTRLAKCFLHNVITNKRWIECKTIDWNSMDSGKQIKNLRHQLLRQQTLVAQYNQLQNQSLPYELFCKYPATTTWAEWFTEHTIPYHVVPDVIDTDEDAL